MTFLENTSRPGASSLLSHKWFDTLPVIPAKAGFQQKLLWIPAFAGKTPVVGMPHDFAGVKLFTRLTTGFVAGSGSTNSTPGCCPTNIAKPGAGPTPIEVIPEGWNPVARTSPLVKAIRA